MAQSFRAGIRQLHPSGRCGVTLVELLAVMAVIGILMAIILVAVQQSREAARRMGCVSHLRQLGIAIANYEQTYKSFPPGVDDNGFSIHTRLLPFLGGTAVYEQLDFTVFHKVPPNKGVLRHGQEVLKCPDNQGVAPSHVRDFTSYVGSAGGGNPAEQNGIFVALGRYGLIRASAVTDGLSHTVAMSEAVAHPGAFPGTQLRGKGAIFRTATTYRIPLQLNALVNDCHADNAAPTHRSLGQDWISGSTAFTRFVHVLPPNSPNCQNGQSVSRAIYAPSSHHPGGVNCLFGDGTVRFVSEDISQVVWIALGTRNGGEVTEDY